ncbi:MAG: DUF2344 domain-containing protein [Gaiellales bacterium]|nr:DUF2344 domain-containing protein [Gaiellales bacterium]
MSGDATARFERVLSRVQNAARLIGGEVGSGPGFSGGAGELRVVLAFPESYEIGISNQAIQILYHVARAMPEVGVERAYLPWVEAIAEMRRSQVPLLTLETWSPVSSAHVLGISLQHELNFTNVLELLDLSGIPLRARERTGLPLVIAGGPATANFLPMAPFLDAVLVGEGEEAFPQMLTQVSAEWREGRSREELKAALARIDGVYVPGVSSRVQRRVLPRLEGAPYPAAGLVPLTAGVHDRAWVEVMRGCTRGCRFCQAGMWYRPVRERSAECVVDLAAAELMATGHQEVALASLSTTDYTQLDRVLADLSARCPEAHVSLPSLRVDSAAVRLGRVLSPRGTSLTLAPEAGSQRLRDVINKNVTQEDIEGAATEAFALGYTTLKLYFMIGLPTETDEDVEAIVHLCQRLRRIGREALGSRSNRLSLRVSATNFIPKPFTPFQWEPMASREDLERRQEILRRGLARLRIRPALHSVDGSYLEATLARGGSETAEVIERAWRQGARFDNWTDQYRPEAWDQAFRAAGLTAEVGATTSYAPDTELPWDVIEGGVPTKGFLWQERVAALAGTVTEDCREGLCGDCGVCEAGTATDLAAAAPAKAAAVTPAGDATVAPAVPTSSLMPAVKAVPASFLLAFAVEGRARFFAHLDTMELLRRAVRRAGGRLALSAGMRPKPLLTVLLPRPVGVEGREELCQFTLAEPAPAECTARLQEALPAGFRVLWLRPWRRREAAAGQVAAVDYEVQVAVAEAASDGARLRELEDASRRYTELSSVEVERRRPGRVQPVDVRQYVDTVKISAREGAVVMEFRSRVSPAGTARPEEVVRALARLSGIDLEVARAVRVRILLSGHKV